MLKYIYHKLLNKFALSFPLRKLWKFTYLKVINLGILDIAAVIAIYFHFEIIHDAKSMNILDVNYLYSFFLCSVTKNNHFIDTNNYMTVTIFFSRTENWRQLVFVPSKYLDCYWRCYSKHMYFLFWEYVVQTFVAMRCNRYYSTSKYIVCFYYCWWNFTVALCLTMQSGLLPSHIHEINYMPWALNFFLWATVCHPITRATRNISIAWCWLGVSNDGVIIAVSTLDTVG